MPPATASPPTPSTPCVTVRYWAAARAATGRGSEQVAGDTVAAVLAECVGRHPGLGPVVTVATVLLDGRAVTDSEMLAEGAVLEILPPFAGG